MASYFQNKQQADTNQQTQNTNQYNQNVKDAQNQLGSTYGNSTGSANEAQQGFENATDQGVLGWGGNGNVQLNGVTSPYTPTGQQGYSPISQGPNYQTGGNDPYNMSQLADVNGLMGLATWGSQQAGNFVPGGSAAGNQAYQNELNSGVYNNSNLALDPTFQQTHQMTPQEIQGLADQAGRTVGNQFQTSMDTARRQAAAAGMSAMGTNALQNRVASESAGQSGDAMANARLNAQLSALGIQQQNEAMRLGAAQTQASDIMNAANSQAALGLSGAEAGAQFGANMGEYVDSNLANRLTNLDLSQQQYGLQQIASQMGQQGQQFNQGLAANQTLSGQEFQQAAQFLQQEGLSTQQIIQLLSAQNTGNQVQGQLQNQGNAQAYQMQQPSLLQQIVGGGLGALSALGGGGGISSLAKLF